MKNIFLSIILLATFAAIGQSAFAGEKVYVCHITSFNLESNRWEGHVIEISVNALATHCSHDDRTDHDPQDVLDDAEVACTDLEGKRYDQCIKKNAVGADCSRHVEDTEAVSTLCGS